MKRISCVFLVLVYLLCLCACGKSKNEPQAQDTTKNEAIAFAIAVGEEHYSDKVNNRQYKSFGTPQIVSVEVLENKYYDIRCSVECVSYNSSVSAEVVELFYSLRLAYDETKNEFKIVDVSYGGF